MAVVLGPLKVIQPDDLDPPPTDLDACEAKMIDSGATSDVYLATLKSEGEVVAVKRLHRFNDPREVVNHRNEVRVMLALFADNPNIVRVFGSVNNPAYPCIVMGYCEHGSLEKLLPLLDIAKKLYALRCVAYGLASVHRHLVAHRDLKTSNILVDGTGRAMIGDFGSVKVVAEASGQTKSTVGTAEYMAPEVAREQCGGHGWLKADIWSFGIVCVKVLTGQLPYDPARVRGEGLLNHIANLKVLSVPKLPSEVPAEIARIIERCLQVAPKDRPTAEQLTSSFEKVLRVALSPSSPGLHRDPAAEAERKRLEQALSEKEQAHADVQRALSEKEQAHVEAQRALAQKEAEAQRARSEKEAEAKRVAELEKRLKEYQLQEERRRGQEAEEQQRKAQEEQRRKAQEAKAVPVVIQPPRPSSGRYFRLCIVIRLLICKQDQGGR